MAASTAIVLCGGDHSDAPTSVDVPAGAYVVAADSGLHLAARLGLAADLVVGDFDSVDAGALDAAVTAGTRAEQHPAAKDATDLELAIDAAIAHGASRVLVVGGTGGRLDHFLGVLFLLASPAYADIAVEARLGSASVQVTHGRTVAIHGAPGDIVTLLPVNGGARGIVTDGLEYPLRNEDLAPGTSRGISNVLLDTDATVTLASGTLLVVQP